MGRYKPQRAGRRRAWWGVPFHSRAKLSAARHRDCSSMRAFMPAPAQAQRNWPAVARKAGVLGPPLLGLAASAAATAPAASRNARGRAALRDMWPTASASEAAVAGSQWFIHQAHLAAASSCASLPRPSNKPWLQRHAVLRRMQARKGKWLGVLGTSGGTGEFVLGWRHWRAVGHALVRQGGRQRRVGRVGSGGGGASALCSQVCRRGGKQRRQAHAVTAAAPSRLHPRQWGWEAVRGREARGLTGITERIC